VIEQACAACVMPWFQYPAVQKYLDWPGVVVQAYNSSTQKVEAGGSRVL
jgi:hypothetical protein